MPTEKKLYPLISKALQSSDTPFPNTLAKDFTRILQQIEMLWGKKDALNYFNSILLDGRGDRQGFPLEAIREIALLKQVHDYLYPTFELDPYDPLSPFGVIPPSVVPPPAAGTIEFTLAPLQSDGQIQNMPSHAPDETGLLPMHGNWPKIRSQQELGESARLRLSGKIYEYQGKPIGEILIHYGFIDERTLRIARRLQEKNEYLDQPLGQILVEINIVKQEDMTCALCVQAGIIMADLLAISVPSETIKLIPSDKAREKQVVPIGVHLDTIYLAVADPFHFTDKPFFSMLTGLKVEPVYVPRNEIVSRLNMYGFSRNMLEAKEEFHTLAQKSYDFMPSPSAVETITREIDISENDATIVNLVNKMILNAIDARASDIHIELFQNCEESEIRFRIDGNMENFSSFPRGYHPAVVSRIKIMAGLDISERRRPQDGKISFALQDGSLIVLRVATIPTMREIEFVTLRILVSGNPLPLAELGMATRDMEIFSELSKRTYGLILVCGPTGSGKTTTIHSVLKELNTKDRKIWTVEDPVEIVQPNLCQVQVHSKIGLTFASTLRALLRADPDIIMIGEMRDQETAKIALEASMTGHLVLSTLHTNSATETVSRLIDLGIDPFNLSDALLAILAQRLARKLCDTCAKREEAPSLELEELANEYHLSAYRKLPTQAERETLIQSWCEAFGEKGKLYFRRPVGCKACNEGYKGRVGLYELLQITPTVRDLIRQKSSASEYQVVGITEGMRTLKQDGIEKILRGFTDITQVRSTCI